MRLLDEKSGQSLARVILYLTRDEAAELRDSLNALLGSSGDRHEHVSSADYRKELTVCLYDEGNLHGFDERSRRLILDDK
jgi:hypothetical protein